MTIKIQRLKAQLLGESYRRRKENCTTKFIILHHRFIVFEGLSPNYELSPGEIRIVIIAVQGEAKAATNSAIAQIRALFLASNGVVCTKARDAATASGD